MAVKKSVKDLDVDQAPEQSNAIDVVVTGNAGTPAVGRPGSDLQQYNDEFEGLDEIGNFMPYFILDGTELLNKVTEASYKDLEVNLTGGKKIWQLWDLSSNLVAESHDGLHSLGGENMNQLLAATKAAHPGEEDKIKIQSRYEIYFMWEYPEEGEKLSKISLSPSSMYAFKDYVADLKKSHHKKTSDVITRISAKRTANKSGQRYSIAQFELVGEA